MAANATRELIKAKFNPFTKMPWIDFNKGDEEVKYLVNLIKKIVKILFRHGYN